MARHVFTSEVPDAAQEHSVAVHFQQASPKLRADRNFVLEVVRLNGAALRYASDTLRKDRDVVLAAVKHKGEALFFAATSVQSDRPFVLEAVKHNGIALRYADMRFRSDREIVLEAVKQSASAFDCASDELLGDRDLVLEVVKQNGSALKRASDELRGDRDVVLHAARQDSACFEFASAALRADDRFKAAVASHLAAEGSLAPVFTVEQIIESAPGFIDVLSYTVAGETYKVCVNARATLSDLATSIVERHGRCTHVFLVLPLHGVVTPWECSRLVTDFVMVET